MPLLSTSCCHVWTLGKADRGGAPGKSTGGNTGGLFPTGSRGQRKGGTIARGGEGQQQGERVILHSLFRIFCWEKKRGGEGGWVRVRAYKSLPQLCRTKSLRLRSGGGEQTLVDVLGWNPDLVATCEP